MTYDPKRERRLAEHRALAAALMLAKLAGWSIDKHAPLLPTAFQDYLYVPETELLLVPTAGPFGRTRAQVDKATREARSDALIVMLGRNHRGLVQPYVSVGLWARERTRWIGPHLPWLDRAGAPWLLPDPDGGAADEPCVLLSAQPMRPAASPPWSSAAERHVGYLRADAAFADLQQEAL